MDDQRRQVTDPKVLGALAHPIRLSLLNHLMSYGPRTASQCAEVVEASPSACSYHLRQLARYELVEPVPGEDGRERPWRATASGYSFRAEPDDPAGIAIQRTLAGLQLDQDDAAARDLLLRFDELPAQWQEVLDYSRFNLVMSAAELGALLAQLAELVRPYRAMVRTDAPADARRVHLDWRAYPEVGQ